MIFHGIFVSQNQCGLVSTQAPPGMMVVPHGPYTFVSRMVCMMPGRELCCAIDFRKIFLDFNCRRSKMPTGHAANSLRSN